MANLETTLTNLMNWVQPITWALVAVALIINGIMCISGSQEGREKAKKSLPWVAIGCILVIGAVTISKEFISHIAF